MNSIRKRWNELDMFEKSFCIAVPLFLLVVMFFLFVIFFPIAAMIMAITALVLLLFCAIWGAVYEVFDENG